MLVVVVVVIEVVDVAGAVEVVISADVVVSKQSKLLHGQPAGQFDLIYVLLFHMNHMI